MTYSCPHCKDAYRQFASLHDWVEHMMRFHDDLMRKRGFIGAFTTDELLIELMMRIHIPKVAAALRATIESKSLPETGRAAQRTAGT